MQLLVLVIILSIFLLNYFDTTYIKICMGLAAISIVMDLIWLMTYAGDHWSPPVNGVYSQNQTGTLRFIVLFTVMMMFAKVPEPHYSGSTRLPTVPIPRGPTKLNLHYFVTGLRQITLDR